MEEGREGERERKEEKGGGVEHEALQFCDSVPPSSSSIPVPLLP